MSSAERPDSTRRTVAILGNGVGGTALAKGFAELVLPRSQVVKAFNIITAGHMVHPRPLDARIQSARAKALSALPA
jgi:hypothetical protein